MLRFRRTFSFMRLFFFQYLTCISLYFGFLCLFRKSMWSCFTMNVYICDYLINIWFTFILSSVLLLPLTLSFFNTHIYYTLFFLSRFIQTNISTFPAFFMQIGLWTLLFFIFGKSFFSKTSFIWWKLLLFLVHDVVFENVDTSTFFGWFFFQLRLFSNGKFFFIEFLLDDDW